MPPETPGTTPQEPETLRFAGQAAVPANPCHDRRSSNTSPLLSEELANDLRAVRSPMPDSSARSILEQSKTPSIEISLALPQEENQNQSCKLRGKTVECFPFRRQQQPAMSSLVTTNTLTARRCVLVEFFLAKALSPCSAARLAECGSLQSRHKSVDDRGDEAFAELPYPATGLAERCSGTQGRPNFSLEVTCRAASFGTMRNAVHSTGLVHSVDCLRSRVPASQLQKHLYMQEPPALRQLGAKRRCLDSNSKHRSLLPCNARMYIMYCASMPEHVRMWSRIVCSTILQLSQQQLFTRFAWQSTRASPDGTATQAANIQRSMRSRDKNCTQSAPALGASASKPLGSRAGP